VIIGTLFTFINIRDFDTNPKRGSEAPNGALTLDPAELGNFRLDPRLLLLLQGQIQRGIGGIKTLKLIMYN